MASRHWARAPASSAACATAVKDSNAPLRTAAAIAFRITPCTNIFFMMYFMVLTFDLELLTGISFLTHKLARIILPPTVRVNVQTFDSQPTFPFGLLGGLPFFSSLSPLRRVFGRRLEDRLLYRPTSDAAKPRRSCRASSTTCMAHSGDNPLANPPKFPGGRAA